MNTQQVTITLDVSAWIQIAANKLGVSLEDFILNAAHIRACEVNRGTCLTDKTKQDIIYDYEVNNLSFFELRDKYRLGSVKDVYEILKQGNVSLYSLNGMSLEDLIKYLGKDMALTDVYIRQSHEDFDKPCHININNSRPVHLRRKQK